MRIIEIAALPNGAHRNQMQHGAIPHGWAAIPDGIEIPATFPFVNIVVDGQRVVSMTAGVVPDPAPVEEIEEVPTEIEQLRADVDYIAMQMGVEL